MDYNISRLGDGEASGVVECDLVCLTGDYIATISRSHSGYLEEAIWHLEPSGAVTLIGSVDTDSVAGVSATTPDGEVIVGAAYTTDHYHLNTYSWVGATFQGEAHGVKTPHRPSVTSFNRTFGFPGPVTPP